MCCGALVALAESDKVAAARGPRQTANCRERSRNFLADFVAQWLIEGLQVRDRLDDILARITRGVGRDLVQFFLTGRQPLCNHGGIASELEQFALGVLLCKLCTGFFARPAPRSAARERNNEPAAMMLMPVASPRSCAGLLLAD